MSMFKITKGSGRFTTNGRYVLTIRLPWRTGVYSIIGDEMRPMSRSVFFAYERIPMLRRGVQIQFGVTFIE
jgi:hypothetical protein